MFAKECLNIKVIEPLHDATQSHFFHAVLPLRLPYDSILFDFDGVLADTEPIHWSCWADTLAPLSIELSWDTYRANCIGVADRDMLVFLASLGSQAVEADSLRPQYATKKALFRRRIGEANPCSGETVDLIRSLSDYRLAVVTSSGRLEVEPVLDRAGIRPHLNAIVFGEDVKRHKPAPDPYLLAAERLGAVRPLVVEDSNAGVASARAAGFDVVQVGSPEEVASAVRSKLKGSP
jgi:HAD superfamily hydrolase (TIGR01509 family)